MDNDFEPHVGQTTIAFAIKIICFERGSRSKLSKE